MVKTKARKESNMNPVNEEERAVKPTWWHDGRKKFRHPTTGEKRYYSRFKSSASGAGVVGGRLSRRGFKAATSAEHYGKEVARRLVAGQEWERAHPLPPSEIDGIMAGAG